MVDRSFGLVHDDSTTDIVTVIALPAYYAVKQGLCNGMVPVLSSLLCPSVPSIDRCMPVLLLWARRAVDIDHVTLTTPTQGTVSHHKAITSRGQPMNKI